MDFEKLTFRVHAIKRMFERRITQADVLEVLNHGQVIATYPDDKPYPSQLLSGKLRNRSLHVVVAYNNEDQERIIVTVYEPDTEKWENDFTRRKK
ncbi:MAG: DUF4258 domain-containing protein [Elusimicrobia bacterium]|nr:DUF4258 domain-containing protein [Candidatus Obscuribacterium magneticum]MCB4756348.1 DUF4258 domain-containing protein [Candidatus Obscuribacterium magneticum]